MGLESAEFVYIKEQTEASAGNLSLQLDKLKEAKYISIKKSYKNNYPVTICSITKTGINAFEKYVLDLRAYIEIEKLDKIVQSKKK
jgi:Winged helix DNA-binding domain